MQVVRPLVRRVRLVPHLLRRAVAKGWHDRVLGLSAEAAFWQLISLPSLFVASIATLGYISRFFGPNTVDRAETEIETTLSRAFSPDVVAQVVSPMLREILHDGRADVISVGFFLALWAGSAATATFVNTITIAYGMRDLRGPVRSRLLALGLFLLSVVVGVVLLPLLVLGPSVVADMFPKHIRPTASTIIQNSYYPVVVLLTLAGLTTLYHLAPPRRLRWRRGLPGALLAMLVFLAGSAGLRSYIHYIVDRSHAYGTLAAPVAALLYLFILALGVLLGAEFNAAIEQHAPTPARTPRVLRARSWRRLPDIQLEESPGGSES